MPMPGTVPQKMTRALALCTSGTGVNTATLAATFTMTQRDEQFQDLDGGVGDRDVVLPPAGPNNTGLFYFIANRGTTNDLVIKDVGSTISTVDFGEQVLVASNGANWKVLMNTSSSADLLAAANTWALLQTFTLGLTISDGGLITQQGNATGVGQVVERLGLTATEGMEKVIYEETITPGAVETNSILVPAGAVILSVMTNVEVALVAGGTSVTLSIGVAADPDKYGTHPGDSLAQNQKISTIPDWAVLTGGAEQIVLTAAATGGTADGDTAFSAGSVRVRVVYYALNELDNA